METFHVSGPLWSFGACPPHRRVTWSFDVLYDVCLNKRLSRQSLWRLFDAMVLIMTSLSCHPTFCIYMSTQKIGFRISFPSGSRPSAPTATKGPHLNMMTSSNGNIFRVTGLLCGEFTGPRWIPHTKASDAELWCNLWSASEQTLEKTIETLVIWYAIALIMTSWQVMELCGNRASITCLPWNTWWSICRRAVDAHRFLMTKFTSIFCPCEYKHAMVIYYDLHFAIRPFKRILVRRKFR